MDSPDPPTRWKGEIVEGECVAENIHPKVLTTGTNLSDKHRRTTCLLRLFCILCGFEKGLSRTVLRKCVSRFPGCRTVLGVGGRYTRLWRSRSEIIVQRFVRLVWYRRCQYHKLDKRTRTCALRPRLRLRSFANVDVVHTYAFFCRVCDYWHRRYQTFAKFWEARKSEGRRARN
jgi:hypothetical protein